MKITAIKPYVVWVGTRNQLIVKVETDEGIHGWGESGMSAREKAVVGALEHYAQFVVGRDPMLSNSIWQEMYRSQYFEGGRVLTQVGLQAAAAEEAVNGAVGGDEHACTGLAVGGAGGFHDGGEDEFRVRLAQRLEGTDQTWETCMHGFTQSVRDKQV